jgi:hypothetical protein
MKKDFDMGFSPTILICQILSSQEKPYPIDHQNLYRTPIITKFTTFSGLNEWIKWLNLKSCVEMEYKFSNSPNR